MRINPLKNWDDEQKAAAVKILGFFIAAITLFILLASVSYLFHWKQDMSLLSNPDMMDSSSEVGNAAGKLGYLTGRFLIGRCFGLGSFAILVILGALSVRLIVHKWAQSLLKTAALTIGGAFTASIILAYLGKIAGLNDLFGGGLGGDCGKAIVDWAANLFGLTVTGFLVMLLVACFLFFCSRRFSSWLSKLGEKAEKSREEKAQAAEAPAPVASPVMAEPAREEPKPAHESYITGIHAAAAASEPENAPAAAGAPVKVPSDPEPKSETSAPEGGTFEVIKDENGLNTEIKKELEPIDNRLDPPDGLPKYQFPSLELLDAHDSNRHEVSNEELARNNNKIRATLANYKIQINDVKAIMGPTVTLYKVYPAPGVQIAQIKRLQEDIAVSLGAKGVRVVTLSDCVGIEVANDKPSMVPLKALLNDEAFRTSKAELPIAIGYTITQKVKVFDLADAPHLLIAGATKQGKSVGLNVIVSSLLYSKHPSELRFVFIDPKMVEFSSYAQLLHHYLAVLPDSVSDEDEKENAIVKAPKDAEKVLRSLCTEMDERYKLLAKAGSGVNNIKLYNQRYKARKLNPEHGHKFMPYLVVVVDEYADLTMMTGASPEARAASRNITNSIIRLAQKGRAAGLHVILATQRPSVDVISGIIKSNFPMRIAFRVASRTDSMTILDANGAEKLIGNGDMLLSAGIDSERIQCGYVSGAEVDKLTEFIGSQQGYARSYNTPYYLPSAEEPGADGEGGGMTSMSDIDERFEEAARLVVTTQKASTSYLQTRLGMGFAKAARVMGQLEAAGIVGEQDGAKPRQILVPDLNSLQPILDAFVK